jgi:uncharacterized membrane protein YhaH (DUF805 family)
MAATTTTGNKEKNPQKPVEGNTIRRLFFVSALNMSWQLAIVVLVPVVGGFKLDQKLHSLPVLTMIGFIVAIVCMVIVVQRQLKAFGPAPKDKND